MSQDFYDIPMIYSAPLVRANLDGLKNHTRRMPTAILDKAFEAYKIGRPVRLWQRENFCLSLPGGQPVFKATFGPELAERFPNIKWKPSIHMHRKFSRFTGLNVQMRKEPVQLIAEEEAGFEGIHEYHCKLHDQAGHENCGSPNHKRETFACLWDSLHAGNPKKPHESWADNPEIYVLIYEGVNRNIDHK